MSRRRPKKATVDEVAAITAARPKPPRPTSKEMARAIFHKEIGVCPVCRHPLIPVSDKRWTCPVEQHTKLINSRTLQAALYAVTIAKRTGNKVHLSVRFLHNDLSTMPLPMRIELRDAPYPPPPEPKPRQKKARANETA